MRRADKASPRELLNELRGGRIGAGYEFFGQQAPVKAWKEALSLLARTPDLVDLELAAHRALLRPPEVVIALLDLAASVDTPQAAFVAPSSAAAAALRDKKEPARAEKLRAELVERHDLGLALAADDGAEALYLVLARELPEQAALAESDLREKSSFEWKAMSVSPLMSTARSPRRCFASVVSTGL